MAHPVSKSDQEGQDTEKKAKMFNKHFGKKKSGKKKVVDKKKPKTQNESKAQVMIDLDMPEARR
jgi:hypothetical protein